MVDCCDGSFANMQATAAINPIGFDTAGNVIIIDAVVFACFLLTLPAHSAVSDSLLNITQYTHTVFFP